jgi:hypothetical protein
VLQTDSTKLRLHYMNSTTFYVDMLCLLPLDFLYLSLHFQVRLFKAYADVLKYFFNAQKLVLGTTFCTLVQHEMFAQNYCTIKPYL